MRFLILPYSQMIYDKNILHPNKVGISSDTRKFWTANVQWLTLFAALKFTQQIRKCYFIDVFIEEDRLNKVKASKYTGTIQIHYM